jgi:hypothetical protein
MRKNVFKRWMYNTGKPRLLSREAFPERAERQFWESLDILYISTNILNLPSGSANDFCASPVSPKGFACSRRFFPLG